MSLCPLTISLLDREPFYYLIDSIRVYKVLTRYYTV